MNERYTCSRFMDCSGRIDCLRWRLSEKRYQRGIAMLRHTIRHTLPAALLLCASALPFTAGAEMPHNLPDRKPGLWEVTTTDSSKGNKPEVELHCVDANTDPKLKALGKAMGEKLAKCKVLEDKKDGAAILSRITCDMGPIKTDSKMRSEGDFSKDFTTVGEVKSEMPGLMKPETTKTTTRSKWLGACKSGQKPGDVVLSDGKTVNLIEGKLP